MSHPAFDHHAVSYDRIWGRDPIASLFRERVHDTVLAHVSRGGRLLDVGCGIGLDAMALAKHYQVVGIDGSAEMVAQARDHARHVRFEQRDLRGLPGDLGIFDGVLSNFGVLNCVEIEEACGPLSATVGPGGVLVAVVMPRLHPTMMLSELKHGHPRRAMRRLRHRLDIPLPEHGGDVSTVYHSPRAVIRAFARHGMSLRDQLSLGALMPPPGTRWPLSFLEALSRLERALGGAALLRHVGDHVVLVLERR